MYIKLFEEFTAVNKKWNERTIIPAVLSHIHNFKPEKLWKKLSITDLREMLPKSADTSRNAALNIEEVQGDTVTSFDNITIGQFDDNNLYRIHETHYILEDANVFQGTNVPNITLLGIYVLNSDENDPYALIAAEDPYNAHMNDYIFLGSIYVDQKAYIKEMSEKFKVWPRGKKKKYNV